MLKTISAFFIVLVFSGCGLAHRTTLLPQSAATQKLGTGEGYLVMGLSSDSLIKGLHIYGPSSFVASFLDDNGRFYYRQHYLVLNLKAGIYKFRQVELNANYYLPIHEYDNQEIWQVSIEPGKINYIGDFELELNVGDDLTFRTEITNRSSFALEYLEERYPQLIKDYEIVYGGVTDDDFFMLSRSFGAVQ